MLADNEYAVPDKSVCSEAPRRERFKCAHLREKSDFSLSASMHKNNNARTAAETSVDSFRRHSLGMAEIPVEMGEVEPESRTWVSHTTQVRPHATQ